MEPAEPRNRIKSGFSAQDAIANAISENPNLSYLLDGVGVVSRLIQADEPGRVKYQQSYWHAIAWDGIAVLPGTRVRIVGVDNITLIVDPLRTSFRA